MITTKLYPNGSFDRHIVFDPSGSAESFRQRYILPSGLSWQVQESALGTKEYRYEAVGHFQGLASDYLRRDEQTPGNTAKNQIAMTVTPEGRCEYRETFQDTTQQPQLRESLERYYRSRTAAIMQHLGKALFTQEHPQTVEIISQGVTRSVLGWLDQVLALYQKMEDKDSEATAVHWLFEEKDFLIILIDRWWKEEGVSYPGEEAAKRIKDTIEAWEKSDLPDQLEAAFAEELERYDGAHGAWGLFGPRFEVTVEMPSTITDSNGHTVEGRLATWEFGSSYFWLKDYTLTAVSACTPSTS